MIPGADTSSQQRPAYVAPLRVLVLQRERCDPSPVRADETSDAHLVFDAIYAAFQARCTMQQVFAQLRGDEDAVG